MKVANAAALRTLMARSGVAVDEDGMASAQPEEKIPEVPRAPIELLTAIRELIDVTRAGNDANTAILTSIASKPEPPEPEPPQAVRKWVFTVEREHGEMSRIVAEAVK